jgi:hypothetical protein
MPLTKHSGYSPPQHLPPAPAKPFVNRHVNSYDVDGRSSNFVASQPKHNETIDVVRRNKGESRG